MIDTLFDRVARFPPANDLAGSAVIARSATPLWTESDQRERPLLAGKVQNLRIAVKALNGVEVPAGSTFSFWKHVGRTTKRRGFAAGRELREGCVIPNIGGGLCQLSNALYDAALQAQFEIIERHAHTRVIAGSLAEQGRDATVFWNYVDLRFRSPSAFRIEAAMTADELKVTFRGTRVQQPILHQIVRRGGPEPNSCAVCEADCHRSVPNERSLAFRGKTAFVVDDFSKEFDDHLLQRRTRDDLLIAPLDGKRFRKPNYAWTTEGYGSYRQNAFITFRRAAAGRRAASQGRERQLKLLSGARDLADASARKLGYEHLELVVHQSLLPFLWLNGSLGGRVFDVLMPALPMDEIQRRLDAAARLHPESRTLSDFRADEQLVNAELEALQRARRVITPHTAVAELFNGKAELLPWHQPAVRAAAARNAARPLIVFPASTLGRKGCYELRDAMQNVDAELAVLGSELEGEDFWNGLSVRKGVPQDVFAADAVVLPAFIEHKPMRLLAAAAAGVPVIASKACGVRGVANVREIDAGEVEQLKQAIVQTVFDNKFRM